jgi:hypothetical protein
VTPTEVLAEVLRAGGRVIPDPARPRLVVPPALKPLVLEHREALRALILAGDSGQPVPVPAATVVGEPPGAGPEALARLLAMSLDVFAREGQPVEVRVRWWPASLWFVPDVRHAEALCRAGVARERLWTATELVGLLSASPLATEALLTVMRARAMFGGEVVEVRRR